MVDTAGSSNLARLDQAINLHRRLWRAALNAGHSGERDWHERECDRLLDLRVHVTAGLSVDVVDVVGFQWR